MGVLEFSIQVRQGCVIGLRSFLLLVSGTPAVSCQYFAQPQVYTLACLS